MNIGKKVHKLRKAKNMSLDEICGKLGWPVSKLSKIERGEQKIYYEELIEVLNILQENMESIVDFGEGCVTFKLIEEEEQVISNEIKEVASRYLSQDKNDFTDNDIGKIIKRSIPKLIMRKSKLNISKYLVVGSIGKGQFAEIPWISLFKNSITTSATRGVYIVYLFTADMKGVYLSLNQGFTFYRNKYGTKEGRKNAKEVAKYLQEECNTIPDDLALKSIELGAKGVLGKGYIPGHIAGKYYDINNLPDDDKLIDDLRNLVMVYEEVSGIINNRTVEEFIQYAISRQKGLIVDSEQTDEEFDETVKDVENNDTQDGYDGAPKIKKDLVKNNKGKEKYPRDSKVSARALKCARYKCECDNGHISFLRKSTGKKYTEPHHLIPIGNHSDFNYSLDTEENICSLCSNCHNCIHYGVDFEREKLLKKLYEERKELLKKAGIGITFEKLKEYYGIK